MCDELFFFSLSFFQLNVKRGVERRKADDIRDIAAPFDPNKFNFTKVKESEILFDMRCCAKRPHNEVNHSLENSANLVSLHVKCCT